jgi:hypothetical protein
MIETIFKVSPDGSTTVVDAIPARSTLFAQNNSLEASLTRAKNEAAEKGTDVFVHPVGYHWERSIATPRPTFKPGDRVRHIGIKSQPTGTVVKTSSSLDEQDEVPVFWDWGTVCSGRVAGAFPENLELLED